MISARQKIDNYFKRLDRLNQKGVKVVLDMITDIQENKLYHKIKVLDKNNNVIQEDTINGNPREYIDTYIKKYGITPRLDFYNLINGKLEYIPTLIERENEKIQYTKP